MIDGCLSDAELENYASPKCVNCDRVTCFVCHRVIYIYYYFCNTFNLVLRVPSKHFIPYKLPKLLVWKLSLPAVAVASWFDETTEQLNIQYSYWRGRGQL